MIKILRLSIAFTVLVQLCGVIESVRAQSDSAAAVQRLLESNCVSCHGEKESKAALRLDRSIRDQIDDYALLEDMVAKIEEGEMPPEDAKKQISSVDKTQLLSLLKQQLDRLDNSQLAGQYKKLTAGEYSNTLADLFGSGIKQLRHLPFDSPNDLKKVGEHQVITSYAVRKYYDVANEYLEQMVLIDKAEVHETIYTAEDEKDLLGRQNVTSVGPLAGGGNEPIFIVRNPVSSYAEEGEYEVSFDWRAFYIPGGQRFDPRKLDSYEKAEVLHQPQIKFFTNAGGHVLNPLEIFKGDKQVLCGIDKPIRIVLSKDLKFLSFRGPDKRFKQLPPDPRAVKIEQSDLPNKEKSDALRAVRQKIKMEAKGKKQMLLLIEGVRIRGPVNKQDPPSHKLIFGDLKRNDSLASCNKRVENLAEKLFRRPVDKTTIDKYQAIAKSEYESSNNAFLAAKVALNAMLCSPHFVFKFEGNQNELDDYMIASRLSYFLWNSGPDDELLKLAAAGKLKDPTVRRQQAFRMLDDREKSDRFTENFTGQWLGLDKFGDYAPNEAYIRDTLFAQLKPHLAREPQAFFSEVLYENLSALNFIDSDFVVWNQPLQSHYSSGSPNLKYNRPKLDEDSDRNQFIRLDLKENPNRVRGGVATMSSIMSLTTDGENTQPILRGVWIARRLLGIEIEAPATIPAIEVNLENVSKPREILAKHKQDASCYACHVKFDYLGLAMENFDVLGKWKTEYVHPVIDEEKNRFVLIKKDAIDSVSETPAGKTMPGVRGVKEHLLENKDVVVKNLIEKLYSYALARKLRYKDRDSVGNLLENMTKNDYKFKDLILELVASESFAQR